jgi:hypothetical protein
VLAGVETEHLQSLVRCLTALDGRDANTRTLRPTFAGGQWTVSRTSTFSRGINYWYYDVS